MNCAISISRVLLAIGKLGSVQAGKNLHDLCRFTAAEDRPGAHVNERMGQIPH